MQRKLKATFGNGLVLTRTTKTATLSHAWRVEGYETWRDGTLHAITRGTGFASGEANARAAVKREYPAKASRLVGPCVLTLVEIVECEVL